MALVHTHNLAIILAEQIHSPHPSLPFIGLCSWSRAAKTLIPRKSCRGSSRSGSRALAFVESAFTTFGIPWTVTYLLHLIFVTTRKGVVSSGAHCGRFTAKIFTDRRKSKVNLFGSRLYVFCAHSARFTPDSALPSNSNYEFVVSM